MRADHNLLHVVGHANLLHSLAGLADEQQQCFEKELAASNAAKVEAWCLHSEQLCTMSIIAARIPCTEPTRKLTIML
jgi:hypothetical protein